MYKAILVRRLLRRHGFQSPIIEVGCGTGEFLAELVRYGHSGVGIDMGSNSIQVAKRRLEGSPIEAFECDLFDHDGRGFNSVFIFEVLEHIEPDVQAMRHLYEMLAPSGLIMLSVPAKQALYTDEDAFQGHIRRYERNELRSKLGEVGFEILTLWCYNPLPYLRKYLMRKVDHGGKSDLTMGLRTEESAYDMHPFTNRWVRRLYPIYSRMKFLLHLQDPFLRFDLGAHYLTVACKPTG